MDPQGILQIPVLKDRKRSYPFLCVSVCQVPETPISLGSESKALSWPQF